MTAPRPTPDVGLNPQRALRELAGLAEPLRLAVRLPQLAAGVHRRSPAARVIVLPGHTFDGRTTAPLQWFLRRRGFDVSDWGLGRNTERAAATVPRVIDRLERHETAPVHLVGQSLGGYVAREVARARPDLVASVTTLGAPLFGPLARRSIMVPVLAFWSERDAVVPPARAVDSSQPDITMVEVRSTHFAMGIDPDVWQRTDAFLAGLTGR